MPTKNKFKPVKPIVYVTKERTTILDRKNININTIGEKGFGLSCIPLQWTLPFIVVSAQLVDEYKNLIAKNQKTDDWLHEWCTRIGTALVKENITGDIIVRSSGCAEGLAQRGDLCSCSGTSTDIFNLLLQCLQDLYSKNNIIHKNIPLVIQQYIKGSIYRGHLSNERRVSAQKRDWTGQIDEYNYIKIHHREWRRSFDINKLSKQSITCSNVKNIKKALEIPATWAAKKLLRLHFEWVLDNNNRIYLVQADQEIDNLGVNPKKEHHKYILPKKFTPECLKLINAEFANKYHKIKNVFKYSQLGFPTPQLYVLADQNIIKKLAQGEVPISLKHDIKELVKNSLVIRMDLSTNNPQERQLLPRTQEERNLGSAIKWLIRNSSIINSITHEVAFIFHNFIPATASAFAYAAPKERLVQIEALWGLPEGLYYNSHDKYLVDTNGLFVDNLNPSNFKIDKKCQYKHFFISPDSNGAWKVKVLKAPYDWKGAIANDEWIKKIALQSRKIAEEEGKSLSIMWFVDVPKCVCDAQVFPWYHEAFDPTITNRIKRTKNSSYKCFTVRTNDDVERLREEAESGNTRIGCIHIQPIEDNLLRNKELLKEIGELTKKINAVILLEGGVLSHAFYQLMQTQAIVEINNPFDKFNYKQYFGKLVRDNIPDIIKNGGETVSIGKLSEQSLLKALKDKLVEETFEAFDVPANDHDSLIDELADITEVIDRILSYLKIDRSILAEKQNAKREYAGGFRDGLVLLATDNPLEQNEKEFSLFGELQDEPSIIDYEDIAPEYDKNTDTRKTPIISESLLRLDIPVNLVNFSILPWCHGAG